MSDSLSQQQLENELVETQRALLKAIEKKHAMELTQAWWQGFATFLFIDAAFHIAIKTLAYMLSR